MSEIGKHNVDEICSSCHGIDWSPMLEVPRKTLPDTGHFLRLTSRITNENALPSTCPICTSLHSITPKLVLRYKLQARLYDLDEHGFMLAAERKRRKLARKDSVLDDPSPGYFQAPLLQPQIPAIVVIRHNSKYTYAKGKMSEVGERGIMAGAVDAALHPVQAVSRDTVNYDIFRAFLDRCERQHHTKPSEALPALEPLSELYVIDVDTMSIVTLPACAPFIALSYVWGQQGSAKDLTRRSRKEFRAGILLDRTSLPLTIRDAALATKMLGRKFLWVDRYCINFTNHAHQSAMISNMDKIYAGAELTIVALSGQNAEAGLPGVSSVLRRQQLQFTAGELTWRSTLPGLKALIRDSVWSTRGWTYQEARLSNTCLFFTDQQVYCVCKHECISESLPSESGMCGLASTFNDVRLDSHLLNTSSENSLAFKDRFAYTQRVLSFEADVLNAYSGLLNRQGFFHISGLPVIVPGSNLSACTGFAMGLLWSSSKDYGRSSVVAFRTKKNLTTRRPGFPSWSWSSVNAPIVSQQISGTESVYAQYKKEVSNFESQSPPTAHFHIADEEGGSCVDLCDAQNLYETTGPKNVSIDKLIVEGDIVKVRLIKYSGVIHHISHFRCCDQEGRLTPYVYRYDALENHLIGNSYLALDLPANCLEPHKFTRLNNEGMSSTDLATIRQAYKWDGMFQSAIMRWSISDDIDDALVLIDWRTDTKEGQVRWVLMLLKWLDDDTAERVGILGDYWETQYAECIDKIPRQRKRFTLV